MLHGISVLNDLESRCPPAKSCREALSRMVEATVEMFSSTTVGLRPEARDFASVHKRQRSHSPVEGRQTKSPRTDEGKVLDDQRESSGKLDTDVTEERIDCTWNDLDKGARVQTLFNNDPSDHTKDNEATGNSFNLMEEFFFGR